MKKTGRLLGIKISATARRYLVVGISVYLFELLVIVGAQRLGASSVTAVGISFWSGLLVSFGLQKLVTFGDKRLHHKIVLPQLVASALLALFNFGFTVVLTWLLSSILPAVVCRTLALGITVIWNYYIYHTRIFTASNTVESTGLSPSKQPAPHFLSERLNIIINKLHFVIISRLRLIAVVGGSFIVAVWTLIRHFSNGVNYDVIGQLSLTDQWSSGLTHGAQLGSTNYLLKMPIYFLINGLESISPRLRLALLVLAFNIATFLLLLKIMEKILDIYQIRDKSWLYLGMLWLASISGRVYWLDYPNSRNLETVGGVFFFYLILRLLRYPKLGPALLTVLVGGVVFFADPLQFFMIGLPVILYFGLLVLIRRTKVHLLQATQIWVIIFSAYIVSKVLFWLSSVALPVSFLKVPMRMPTVTLFNGIESLKNTSLETLKIFYSNFMSAPHNLTTVSRLLDFIVLLAILTLMTKMLRSKKQPKASKNMLLIIIVLMFGVYIASGQALLADTSRYLIMVPLFTLIVVAIWGEQCFAPSKAKIQIGWLAIIIINSCLLMGALYISYSNRYAKEAYTYQIQSFMKQNNFRYAVTSREFALPTNYYTDRRLFIMPVICTPDHKLRETNLFYDKAAFEILQTYHGEIPVLLQDSRLRQGSTCSKEDIIKQLGTPAKQSSISGLGEVLIYQSGNLDLK